MSNNNNEKSVIQSNIITNSTFNHSTMEENLLSFIAYSLPFSNQDDKQKTLVKLNLSQLCEIAGKKKIPTNYIKNIVSNITDIKYHIKWKNVKNTDFENLFLDTSNITDDSYVFVNCIISSQYNRGEITLNINPVMIPFFSNLKEQFTVYDFHTYMRLESFYSKRFFAFFSMFRSTGIFKKKVADLKELFKLEDKYPLYNNFKRRVLEPSIKEINASTNFTVTMEEEKQGKKVETLIFRFTEKKGAKAAIEVSKPIEAAEIIENPLSEKAQRLQMRLQEIGLDQKTIVIALDKYQAQPDWKIWPEVNAVKSAILDKKDFPNKFTLKKFIEGK